MTQYAPISKGAVKFKNFAEMKHPYLLFQMFSYSEFFHHWLNRISAMIYD